MELAPCGSKAGGCGPCGQLTSTPLFAALRRAARPTPVRRGDVLVREGDPPDFLGLVFAGQVKVFKTAADGRELILHVLGPDRAFGIVPVVDADAYPATVEALCDGTWGRVDTPRFLETLRADPVLALELTRAFGGRLRRMVDSMLLASTRSVAGRLAERLVLLAEGHDDVALTRQELADLAGTTVETAIRVTKDWERSGILRLSRGNIRVLDEKRLRLLAAGP